MKIYTVNGEEYYTLKSAKAVMKATGAKGYITKIRSNGDFEECGEITLTGSNKTFMANTRQTVKGY